MRRSTNIASAVRGAVARRVAVLAAALLLLPAVAFAQSPWERAAANLEASFTGPLARSLALVAIVIGGLMFMFGEGGAKRQISGIVFGGGLCALRRPVPGLAVLTSAAERRHGRRQPSRVPPRLPGAAPSADRLRRRSAPVLPRAARRRRDVQPVLQLPRRLPAVRACSTPSRWWSTTHDPQMLQILLRSGHEPQLATTPRSTRPRRRAKGRCAMVSVSRILKDYRDAGTRQRPARALGLRRRPRVPDEGRRARASSIACDGADYECLDHAERRAIAHRFEQALRQLDESFRVYQYLIKRPAAPIAGRPHAHPVVDEALQQPRRVLRGEGGRALRARAVPRRPLRGLDGSAEPVGAARRLLRVAAAGRARALSVARPDRGACRTQLGRAVAHLHQKARRLRDAARGHRARRRCCRRPTRSAFFGSSLNYAPHKADAVAPEVRHASRLLRRRLRRSTATAITSRSTATTSRC